MFKQFTEHINGNQVYLLSSLAIFFVFFVVIAVLLVRMRKKYVKYMSDLPLKDAQHEPHNHLEP